MRPGPRVARARAARRVALGGDHEHVLGGLAGGQLPAEVTERTHPRGHRRGELLRRRAAGDALLGERAALAGPPLPERRDACGPRAASERAVRLGRVATSEPGDAFALAGLLVEVLVLEQVQHGDAELAAGREVQSTWKNSLTTWGRVRMMTSRASTSETLATSARIGSLVTGSPKALPPAFSIAWMVASTPSRQVSSSSLRSPSMSASPDGDRRGGQHLAGGQRSHRRLHARRGVLDRQQHVVDDRVLDVLVQAAQVGGVRRA